LKNRRVSKGSIEFSLPEIKIELDAEGNPTNIYPYKLFESNNIIEEFMLIANVCAADFLSKHSEKLPAVYRIHDKPSEDKLMQFFKDIEQNGINIKVKKNISDHKFIQEVLAIIKQNPSGDILTSNFLRSMMKAKYSVTNIGHYGLAFELYTHFTSPIRRYPDLMVHRLIKKNLGKLAINSKTDSSSNYERKCLICSMKEIKSIKAEYEARDLKITQFMAGKVGNTYHGTVSTVNSFGAYVKLDEIPIEGMIHLKKQTEDQFTYDPDTNCIIGSKKGIKLFVGSKVTIVVLDVNTDLLLIDFKLIIDDSNTK